MAFGKPKAGPHHSANQVRRGFKARTGRRSRKHACVTCGGRNYRRVCADCYSPEAKLLAAIAAKDQLRDVRIATLIEAARRSCERHETRNLWMLHDVGYFHDRDHDYDDPYCRATVIVGMLVEMWGEN